MYGFTRIYFFEGVGKTLSLEGKRTPSIELEEKIFKMLKRNR